MSELLDRLARQAPARIAVRAPGAALSFGELVAAARRAAGGLARGERIGWLGANDPAQLVLLFACAAAGAAQVPLNWRLAEEELAWIAGDAGLSRVVVPGAAEGAIGPAARVPIAALHGAAPAESAASDPLLICYTSGTTGRPKGAVLTQANILANAQHAIALFRITPEDRVLTVLPMFHVGGLNIQTVPALLAGAEVLLPPRFDADGFFESCARDRPTLSLLVPAVMQALVSHPRWRSADLSSLRAVGAGSSEVPLPLIEAFHARGIPVQQIYGASETAPIAIAQTAEEALAAPGSIGRPVGAVEARLGARDEIWVRGPNVMAGYLKGGGLEPGGWFATGDVGQVDAAGRWWFTDRIKHVIISGGENIYPTEVERVLRGAPGVAECAVVGAPDPRWGEVPVAVIVPAEGFDEAAVLRHFDGRLARFKHPRRIILTDALPRTALGKVALHLVREMAAA